MREVMLSSSSANRPNSTSTHANESTDLIVDCLENAIHYILYKRMVYPRDKFHDIHKFGMGMVNLRDLDLRQYIGTVMEAVRDHIGRGTLRRVVLCIIRISTRDVVERWQFRVLPIEGGGLPPVGAQDSSVKDRVQSEFSQIIKQIGVSFLPPLEHACSFKVLLYTDKSSAEKDDENWIAVHPHSVKDRSDEVLQLRPLNTPDHQILAEVVFTAES